MWPSRQLPVHGSSGCWQIKPGSKSADLRNLPEFTPGTFHMLLLHHRCNLGGLQESENVDIAIRAAAPASCWRNFCARRPTRLDHGSTLCTRPCHSLGDHAELFCLGGLRG